MLTTPNLALRKPEGTDVVDIADLNANADILDAALTGKVDKVAGKQLSTEDFTAAEKSKLAGITAGAAANQNAFSNVLVGGTSVAADNPTDTLELIAGAGITLTPDATLDKVTITADHSALAPKASPALTGIPTAPTASVGTNTLQLATTAFVQAEIAADTATVAPVMDGTAAVGTSAKLAREDHRHPTDTTRAAVASPTFTGVPAAPTAAAGTNTTQLATTAFVTTAVSTKANTASPTFTGVPAAPTAAAGTNTTQLATTAFVQTAIVNKRDAGLSNTDTDLVYALMVEIDTRNVNITRDAGTGRISRVDVRNGTTIVQSYAITRGQDGKIDKVVETAAGKTITHTIARDADRKVSGITKTVA